MERKDILKNPEYWTTKTQLDLYECAQKFMEKHGLDRTRLAEHLGVSKGYVTQLLNGDYDHRMSKFFELALSFGVVPKIEFIPIEKYIELDGQIKTYKEVKVNADEIDNWSALTCEKIHTSGKLSSFQHSLKVA